MTEPGTFAHKRSGLDQSLDQSPAFLKLSAAWDFGINYSNGCYCKALVLISFGHSTSHDIFFFNLFYWGDILSSSLQ